MSIIDADGIIMHVLNARKRSNLSKEFYGVMSMVKSSLNLQYQG